MACKYRNDVGVAGKSRTRSADIVEANHIKILFFQLCPRIVLDIVRFSRKSHNKNIVQKIAFKAKLRNVPEDIRILF